MSLLLILLFTCCMAWAQTNSQPNAAPAQKVTCAAPAKYRIVAQRSGSATDKSKYALAIDQDSRVLLMLLSDTGKADESELLGYEPETIVESPIATLLPADQALLTVRRITCPDRWRLWVALTIGFSASPDKRPFALANFVYIFREQDQKHVTTLLTESFPEGAELTVDDINGDQATEMAVQYPGDGDKFTSLLKLWAIDADGTPRPVALANVLRDIPATSTQAEIGLADYRHGEDVLYSESRTRSPRGTGVVRRTYGWDDATQRYTLRDVIRTLETEIK